jgi:hypothetical protein
LRARDPARRRGVLKIDACQRHIDSATGRYRPLSPNQKQVNTAPARLRGPGERVNAELKNWKILRKIRSSPTEQPTSSPQFRHS